MYIFYKHEISVISCLKIDLLVDYTLQAIQRHKVKQLFNDNNNKVNNI